MVRGVVAWSASMVWTMVLSGAVVPAQTVIGVRLRQEINSYSSRPGTMIQGVVIAPVRSSEGRIVIPAGSIVKGTVRAARRVGTGIVYERARLELDFDLLELPLGPMINLPARLEEVENARETVDRKGRVEGIRATRAPGRRAARLLTSLASVDPIALIFSTAAFGSILRMPESEIHYPVGTELRLRLESAVNVDWGGGAESAAATEPGDDLKRLVREMPFRTQTEAKVPSDPTNLILFGTREAIKRSFEAAGWVEADPSNAQTRYRTLRSFAETQAYHEAPMSVLLLGKARPELEMSKGLNTLSKRHHVRIFAQPGTWRGQPIFTASATHDVAIVMAVKQRTITHRIDPRIDAEREKVINDLVFTGCAALLGRAGRPWLPKDLSNGTGQLLETDGAIAVLEFNGCEQPRRFDEAGEGEPGPARGPAAVRSFRQVMLTVKDDVMRGNIGYQAVSMTMSGQRWVRRWMENRNQPGFGESAHAVKSALPHASANEVLEFEPVWPMPGGGGEMNPGTRRRENTDPWTPPRVELSLHLGASRFRDRSAGQEGLSIVRRPLPMGPLVRYSLVAGNRIDPGLAIGGSVTLNTHRWVSHELSLNYQSGTYRLDLAGADATGDNVVRTIEENRARLWTRQVSYNTVVNLRPRESRWTPYVAAGPAFQLMHLADQPFRKARGVYRFGLSNVGMLRAAYNFGSAPPLEGGGIFQLGMQVGGGVKVRVHPRWTLRVDYRDTMTRAANFLEKSLSPEPRTDLVAIPRLSANRVNQHRVTAGFAFTF